MQPPTPGLHPNTPRSRGTRSRTRLFWQQITDGIALQQLWAQFQTEARASYRLYSREVDWKQGEAETRWQHWKRIARGLFWAMVMKLTPARRVLFIAALVMLFFPGIDLRVREVQVQTANLSFFGAIILLVLLCLELADRVTMKRDLEIAKEIQSWMMPVAPPQIPGIEIAFATRPANTVAGDYYDVFFRPGKTDDEKCSNSLLIVVADVAGKSVPAALLMATLRASLRTLAGACGSLQELMERLNRYACEQNAGGQRFTTVFLAELDLDTRQLTYINAGHNWPVLRHATGEIERLQAGGLPIGLLTNARYEWGTATLNGGDTLLVFTDGLIEAENASEDEYGEDRMLAMLNASSQIGANELLRRLMAAVDGFVGTAPQHDDITCLVLRETSALSGSPLPESRSSVAVSAPVPCLMSVNDRPA